MFVNRIALAGIAVIALATAACGGGGGSSSPVPVAAAATATPTAAAGTQAVSASAGGTTAALTVTAGATVSAQAATSVPTGTTTLALKHIASLGTSLIYVTLTASANTTITALGGTFTLAAIPTQNVYLAFWTGSAWANVSATAGVFGGTTVTFPVQALAPVIAATPTAFLAIYTASAANALPTANPSGATATPSPAATASASPTASPSGGTAFVDTVCPQAAAAPSNTLTNVASTFFTTIIPTAKKICLSAWDLSGNIASALELAAQNGASVTVITPYSENSSNSTYLAAIVAAGGHAKTEYTTSSGAGTASASVAYQVSPMDIHAKFALVDGIAYMDGHNWFTTDVVMRDGYAADFAAIQSDLVSFATPAPSGSGATATFTTDKQLSLDNESMYLQSVIPTLTSSSEYDFVTESFNPNPVTPYYNDDVYDGMCQIASLASHPTMHVLVESFSGYSSSAQAALQNLVLLDPNAQVVTEGAGGLEKISMVRPTVNGTPASAWFGSSNATTTDLFDWGMDISDPGMLSALGTWFSTAFTNGTTAIPAAAAGTVATACGTVHS